MGRKAELSVGERAVIMALHKEGYSKLKIASKTSVSQNADSPKSCISVQKKNCGSQICFSIR